MQHSVTTEQWVGVPLKVLVPYERRHHDFEVVTHSEYDAPFIGHDLSILDIGANIGLFALWAYHRFPNSLITCYEPNRATVEDFLRPNLQHYQHRIYIVPAAVYPSKTDVYLTSRFSGDPEASVALEGTKVDTIQPEELPECDILKLDVEGAEFAILSHYPHWARLSLLMLEYHSEEQYTQCLREARNNGFVTIVRNMHHENTMIKRYCGVVICRNTRYFSKNLHEQR